MTWTEFFSLRIPHIYFVYGLAFFVLGLAVALEVWRAEPTLLRQVMWPLAFFGLIHGAHEWMEMFVIVGQQTYSFQAALGFEMFRLILLVTSFTALVIFGTQNLSLFSKLSHPGVWIGVGVLLLYGFGLILLSQRIFWPQPEWFAAADALARYLLAMPGALLAAWALSSQRRRFLRQKQTIFANDLLWVALAFLLYGVVGQMFVNPSPLFPSTIINANTFQNWFIIPVQLFRAIMAVIIAIFTIRALRAFEFNRQQELAAARQRVQEEIAQRDALRQEFLHRVVETQEEERARIARELHDELGQTLTGLALGLRGAQISVNSPDLHRKQLSQLEEMAVQAISNMRHMVTELRPALLDDVGLPAALRHYTENFSALTGVETTLTMGQNHARLPGDVETILFRITQEALTNVARHAQATRTQVDLHCNNNYAALNIKDNGVGFDPNIICSDSDRPCWGLMGMQERVNLTNGTMQIHSETGKGTELVIKVPLVTQENNNGIYKADAG